MQVSGGRMALSGLSTRQPHFGERFKVQPQGQESDQAKALLPLKTQKSAQKETVIPVAKKQAVIKKEADKPAPEEEKKDRILQERVFADNLGLSGGMSIAGGLWSAGAGLFTSGPLALLGGSSGGLHSATGGILLLNRYEALERLAAEKVREPEAKAEANKPNEKKIAVAPMPQLVQKPEAEAKTPGKSSNETEIKPAT